MTTTDSRPCAICGRRDRPVTRYGLRTQIRSASGPVSRGAGGIDLCLPCWRQHAEPNKR